MLPSAKPKMMTLKISENSTCTKIFSRHYDKALPRIVAHELEASCTHLAVSGCHGVARDWGHVLPARANHSNIYTDVDAPVVRCCVGAHKPDRTKTSQVALAYCTAIAHCLCEFKRSNVCGRTLASCVRRADSIVVAHRSRPIKTNQIGNE